MLKYSDKDRVQQNTYISELMRLLDRSPMVTEEQAVEFIGRVQDAASLKSVYRSVHIADAYNHIWREHLKYVEDGEVKELIMVARDRSAANSVAAKDFPYAFWLYLACGHFETPCECAEFPLCASFIKPKKDGNETIAQVAVYDCAGNVTPLSLATSVMRYTQDFGKLWLQPYGESPEALVESHWRALILLHADNDFLRSKGFLQLQGLGFSQFFAADNYTTPPRLVAQQKSPKAAWKRILEAGWR